LRGFLVEIKRAGSIQWIQRSAIPGARCNENLIGIGRLSGSDAGDVTVGREWEECMMRGIKEGLIGFVDVEHDAAGEDGVDHTRQPTTRELGIFLHAKLPWGGLTRK
jgi:hypothetical protein